MVFKKGGINIQAVGYKWGAYGIEKMTINLSQLKIAQLQSKYNSTVKQTDLTKTPICSTLKKLVNSGGQDWLLTCGEQNDIYLW